MERQLKDNDIIIFNSKTKTNKEREKLANIENNMNEIDKSLIYNSSIWSKLFDNKELPSSNDWLWNNEMIN